MEARQPILKYDTQWAKGANLTKHRKIIVASALGVLRVGRLILRNRLSDSQDYNHCDNQRK